MGKKEECGKNCVGEYCSRHTCRLRKGYKPPSPCRDCGEGVNSRSIYGKCRECWPIMRLRSIRKSEKLAKEIRQEEKAKKQF